MTLKAAVLYQEIRHALGGRMSKRLRLQDIANDALDQVTQMHPWEWLQGGYAHLAGRPTVSVTALDWTAATKTLSDPLAAGTKFAGYTFQEGADWFEVTAGTGATQGFFQIASKAADHNSIVLEESISSVDLLAADDIAGTIESRAIPLPADFRSLLDAQWTGWTSSIHLSNPEAVAYRRAKGLLVDEWAYRASVQWSGDPLTPLLFIAPSFATATDTNIQIVYKRKIPYVTTDRSDVVVPEWMHRLVKDACRAVAMGLEMSSGGDVDDRIAKLMSGPVFHNAVGEDGGAQEFLGVLEGGHVSTRSTRLPLGVRTDLAIGGPT